MESDPDINITDPFSCATYTTFFLLITLFWPSVIYYYTETQLVTWSLFVKFTIGHFYL